MSPLARALLAELAGDVDALRELADALAPFLPAPAAEEDRWLDAREAAAHLGMSTNALHKLTAARAVPFSQDTRGGKTWFLRSELDAWRRGSS